MEKDKVIALRTALKGGKNIPLRVYVDNAFRIVDESNKLQFTKWDDTNGILYSFAITDPVSSKMPSNEEQCVSMFAVDYEYIECMEAVFVPLKDFDAVIGTIEASGATMSDNFKAAMKSVFTGALNFNNPNMSPTDINKLYKIDDFVDAKDDWYNDKFKESFKETRQKAEINAYADKVKNEADNGNNGDGNTP